MIFSLSDYLKPTALKVVYNNSPISYSWGNIDALHKWIEHKNKQKIKKALGINGSEKYPLVWLAEGWTGKELIPGINFTNVNFYIAKSSNIQSLNEQRVPNFNLLYKIANDFIVELKKVSKIKENNITFFERPNFNTVSSSPDSVVKALSTLDIWDCLILSLDLYIVPTNENCFK